MISLTSADEKRILLIYSGGTIGMDHSIPGDHGTPLAPREYEHVEPYIPFKELEEHGIKFVLPKTGVKAKDSSNTTPEDWKLFAEEIHAQRGQIGGALILHGTDTMHYTASALSFMLDNLPFPVVLTGSHAPIWNPRTDAVQNIVTGAFIAAGRTQEEEIPRIPEVCIYSYFTRNILRGNRTIEWQVGGGYRSLKYPELGRAEVGIQVYPERTLPQPKGDQEFTLNTSTETNVVSLTQSMDWIMLPTLKCYLQSEDARGFVLAHDMTKYEEPSRELLAALYEAAKNGKFVGLIPATQGGLDATPGFRNRLRDNGVAYGHDMTFPPATTKTMHLLGNYDVAKARDLFEKNLRGELTGPLYRTA